MTKIYFLKLIMKQGIDKLSRCLIREMSFIT